MTEHICPDCDSKKVVTEQLDDTFQYGLDADHVMLTVNIPVERCEDCGAQFCGWKAEEIREAAVQEHLSKKKIN